MIKETLTRGNEVLLELLDKKSPKFDASSSKVKTVRDNRGF